MFDVSRKVDFIRLDNKSGTAIFDYIEICYNRQKIPFALGGLIIVEFKKIFKRNLKYWIYKRQADFN